MRPMSRIALLGLAAVLLLPAGAQAGGLGFVALTGLTIPVAAAVFYSSFGWSRRPELSAL